MCVHACMCCYSSTSIVVCGDYQMQNKKKLNVGGAPILCESWCEKVEKEKRKMLKEVYVY